MFVLLAWLGGTGEGFFTAARDALTVELAPRGQLVNANALYGLASSATRIAGPALGGVLVALAGPGVVVAVDAGSYAVSVLALGLLQLPGPTAARDGKTAQDKTAEDKTAEDKTAEDKTAGARQPRSARRAGTTRGCAGCCGGTWPRAGPSSGP